MPPDSAITRTGANRCLSAQTLNTVSTLVPAFDHQDEIFSSALAILRQAIADRAFPAASVAVTHAGRLVALKALGHFAYETGPGAPLLAAFARSGNFDVNTATLFDLASLTKVVSTTTMAVILYERGLLELDAPVIGVIPEFRSPSDPRRDSVSFRMLLAHSSGLPAYDKLFLKARTRDDLLHAAFTTPFSADPSRIRSL